MEYLIGAVVCFFMMFFMSKHYQKQAPRIRVNLKYSQSYVYDMIAPYSPKPIQENKKKTQSKKHFDKKFIRIMFIDGFAYWIKDGTFYRANIVNGGVDQESTKKVDTMAMDDVELKKMIYIVDKLTEGLSDDSGNSGNK